MDKHTTSLPAVFLLMLSCATEPSFVAALSAMQGKPVDLAIQSMGAPDAITIVQGTAYYRWHFSHTKEMLSLHAVPTRGTDGAGTSGGSTLYQSRQRIVQSCVVELQIGSEGTVMKVTHRSQHAGCRRWWQQRSQQHQD